MYAHQAEVYAAYLAYTDHEIGRVIQAVEDIGKLNDTLIICISGDNGSCAEGTLIGTPNEVASFNGVDVTLQLKPPALRAADRAILQYKARRNNAASQ